jgi:hypothetical protein
MTIGTAQLDAIAGGLKAHGTGATNVVRLATMFGLSVESLTEAVTLAESATTAALTETRAETEPTADPVALARARRFRDDVNSAEAKPLDQASTGDLATLVAARMSA